MSLDPKSAVCVTGGAGFIGANVAAYYLRQGYPVTVFDNQSRPLVERNLNWLKTLASPDQLQINLGDVRDREAVNQAVSHKQLIFHFAGQTAVTTSIHDPVNDFTVNALGTLNVLEAMRCYAPDSIFLYSSTNKVYGDLAQAEIKETPKRYDLLEPVAFNEQTPLDLYTPYGCSKGAGDQYVHDYARIFGLKTIVFRQSCIYGEHQFGLEDQGWVAHFISQTLKSKPITIFGNGKQVRDLLHIDDLINAYILAINSIQTTSGQVYNIGGGLHHTISLLELVELLKTLNELPIEVKFAPPRHADQKIYISDISKALTDFGWEPQIAIPNGVDRLYNWLKDNL